MFKKYLDLGVSALLVLFFVAAAITFPSVVQAQPYESPNFDARVAASAGVTRTFSSTQWDEIQSLRQQMPDLAASVDERTGVTSAVSNWVGHLSGPSLPRRLAFDEPGRL